MWTKWVIHVSFYEYCTCTGLRKDKQALMGGQCSVSIIIRQFNADVVLLVGHHSVPMKKQGYSKLYRINTFWLAKGDICR